MGCLGGSGLLSGRGLNGGFTRSLVSQSLEIDHSSSVTRGERAVRGVPVLHRSYLPRGQARSQQPFAGGELGDSRPRSSEPMGSTPAIWAGSQGVSGRPPSYGGRRAHGGRRGQELHRDGAHVVEIDRRRLKR